MKKGKEKCCSNSKCRHGGGHIPGLGLSPTLSADYFICGEADTSDAGQASAGALLPIGVFPECSEHVETGGSLISFQSSVDGGDELDKFPIVEEKQASRYFQKSSFIIPQIIVSSVDGTFNFMWIVFCLLVKQDNLSKVAKLDWQMSFLSACIVLACADSFVHIGIYQEVYDPSCPTKSDNSFNQWCQRFCRLACSLETITAPLAIRGMLMGIFEYESNTAEQSIFLSLTLFSFIVTLFNYEVIEKFTRRLTQNAMTIPLVQGEAGYSNDQANSQYGNAFLSCMAAQKTKEIKLWSRVLLESINNIVDVTQLFIKCINPLIWLGLSVFSIKKAENALADSLLKMLMVIVSLYLVYPCAQTLHCVYYFGLFGENKRTLMAPNEIARLTYRATCCDIVRYASAPFAGITLFSESDINGFDFKSDSVQVAGYMSTVVFALLALNAWGVFEKWNNVHLAGEVKVGCSCCSSITK